MGPLYDIDVKQLFYFLNMLRFELGLLKSRSREEVSHSQVRTFGTYLATHLKLPDIRGQP